MDRKAYEKNLAPPSNQQQKPATSKSYADPPPSVVAEPEDGGERYAIGAFLGKGGFAVCYEGSLARNGRVYAMKVVKSQMPQRKMEEKVRRGSESNLFQLSDLCPSFEPSFKSTRRCATLSSYNSTERSLLNPAHTLFWSYVRMGR